MESTYAVTGLTCEHCVAKVRSSIGALDGIDSVTVDLVPNGASSVTVSAARPPDRRVIRATLAAAGYRLA